MTWWNSSDASDARAQPRSSGPRLLVGTSDNGVVVLEAELASVLTQVWEALRLAQDGRLTVAELLSRLPEPYRSDAQEIADSVAADAPPADIVDAIYDSAMEGGVEWPEQEMLTLLPEPVLAQYGETSFSGVSGPCVIVPESNRSSLVEALRQWGFEVIEDDEAVARAQPT